MSDPERLARAEDEDFRAEQGELGEDEYEFLHDAAQIEADLRAKYSTPPDASK